MRRRQVTNLVIGSGAAGLAAALRLDQAGCPAVIYTEGLRKGTSINTGSDKQTYYKLGMYGAEPDSPELMARDMMSGGSMHGDLALCESALSVPSFMLLASLGVPFPHDEFGQYIGYKTDHDPKRRATSCGPYTSREMCLALIAELQRRGVEICEKKYAVELFVRDQVCYGALFLDLDPAAEDPWELVEARHTVFACGGPGGLYAHSVYPAVHTGSIGLALRAGAKARNLAESQFGLATTQFRWNVSGSYMQVLPRFISVDEKGTEREFLRETFDSAAEMYDMIFLKGYQWPFAANHVEGSSRVDLAVYHETVELGRKVYLDYRRDPADFDWNILSAETREYLTRSGALGSTPYERLCQLNQPAVELYREHGLDPAKVPLEIAVCAQHNNGGLAGDRNWESENIRNLFPVGEVNGSHGATRPGGTALNAGQCGALRAAEEIARREQGAPENEMQLTENDSAILPRLTLPHTADWREDRRILRKRMSACGAFLRKRESVAAGLKEAEMQLDALRRGGWLGCSAKEIAEDLCNEQLLTAETAYLSAILAHIESGAGSRGGALILNPKGQSVKEDESFRSKTLETVLADDGTWRNTWVPLRSLPVSDGWFETVWKEFNQQNPKRRI